MIMTSLQNFINRRATSRNTATRSESPVKQHPSTFPNGPSHIPLASTRVPSRSSRGAPAAELRDDSDEFKDSEILSLENQDSDGYDDDDDDRSERDDNGEFLHDFNREEVGGRYLLNTHHNGAAINAPLQRNGGTTGGGGSDVYRWQKNVVPANDVMSSDEESDGRVTPRIRIADEPPVSIAASERARTPPNREDSDLANDQLQQEQFYTSIEFEPPIEEVPLPSTSDGVEDGRNDINALKGSQSWEEIDREYSQHHKATVMPVRFNVSGLFEALKEMGVPIRGTERLVLQDTLSHYKLFSIHNPTLPYQILIPYTPSNPSEPTKMLSEIATISFIRRTSPSIPTPEIAYHNLDPSNASRVPFMVIRTLRGRSVVSLEGGIPSALKDRKRSASLLDGLARMQCQIMRSTTASNSLNVDRIGNIYFKMEAKKPKQTFTLGPFLGTDEDSSQDPEASAPVTELADLCLQVFQSAETSSLSLAAGGNNGRYKEIRTVKRRLAGLLGLLPSVPEAYSQLTLFHNSLSIGNILIDPATSAITCVLGWRDVYTIPFALTPVYPVELYPTNSEWRLWSGSDDAGISGVDRYWGLRSIYETRMAKYDARFAGDVWDDEEVGGWLRVWEVVNGGVEGWVKRRGWIEGELERLRRL
ncbi:uncharacterized protein DFL_001489 [Arthrobotrys flagrans]|uniref:Aminoglycoside phosphotransferase domain-containing protein n=1 Tax=Arthrobotrys flagrans TaxID=97331 RepID=A0A437A880_ARTFL|nr:hypothetical protein DFL_001489 [Arthrobotrys flagrans]